MTNKEKYQKAFSVLHASGSISMEEENMNKKKNAYWEPSDPYVAGR